jgi:hypothetical protein
VSSATASTLQAVGTPFGSTNFTGYTVKITAGTGQGQARTILSNTNNTLNLTQVWQTIPDNTSRFEVGTGVDSYSAPADPTFVDWGNLRMDFQKAFVHLGDTLKTRWSMSSTRRQRRPARIRTRWEIRWTAPN